MKSAAKHWALERQIVLPPTGWEASADTDGLVVENDQLIGPERCRGVGPPFAVTELHFEDVRAQNLDDRAHLPATQPALERIFG